MFLFTVKISTFICHQIPVTVTNYSFQSQLPYMVTSHSYQLQLPVTVTT